MKKSYHSQQDIELAHTVLTAIMPKLNGTSELHNQAAVYLANENMRQKLYTHDDLPAIEALRSVMGGKTYAFPDYLRKRCQAVAQKILERENQAGVTYDQQLARTVLAVVWPKLDGTGDVATQFRRYCWLQKAGGIKNQFGDAAVEAFTEVISGAEKNFAPEKSTRCRNLADMIFAIEVQDIFPVALDNDAKERLGKLQHGRWPKQLNTDKVLDKIVEGVHARYKAEHGKPLTYSERLLRAMHSPNERGVKK